ncbi:MAG: NAD(P)-dependent oxidoreductase [Acidobacteria bacterium]|nr:NAD(P)-dependent oxidoreductase [Acidobacteriota bacterium]
MRVLVTGSSGCIGAWTVKQLLDRGFDVLCYDQEADLSRLGLISGHVGSKQLEVQTGAIEDTTRVKALVKDGGVTHILHLAAVLMPFCQAQPVQGGLIDVIGTLNVFEAARDAGRAVRVVYASSSAVWGPEDAYGDRPLSEKDSPLPGTHYGVFKQANEGNARIFYTANSISSIGLRPWTVYGVGRDRGLTADPTLAMKAVALGVPFQIRVSGHMDLQYVEDVAETFVRCVLSDVAGAHVFNLVGSIVEMNALAGLLEKHRPGVAARLITVSGPQVPVSYKMDGSALHAAVPGIPQTPLEDGIRQTLDRFDRLRAEGRLAPLA